MRRRLPPSALIVFGVVFIGATWTFRHMVGRLYAAENADGMWHLVHRMPWTEALVTAALAAALATSLWILLRRRMTQARGGSWTPAIVTLVTAVALSASLVNQFVGGRLGCDGSVPRWMLPAEYDGGGCIPMPLNLEDVPEHAMAIDRVCLGLCVSD